VGFAALCCIHWLVVSTPLKNISQLGWLFQIYGNIKHVPNHQPGHLYSAIFASNPSIVKGPLCGTWVPLIRIGCGWTIPKYQRVSPDPPFKIYYPFLDLKWVYVKLGPQNGNSMGNWYEMMDMGLEGMRVCTFEMDPYCNGKNRYQNIYVYYLNIYIYIYPDQRPWGSAHRFLELVHLVSYIYIYIYYCTYINKYIFCVYFIHCVYNRVYMDMLLANPRTKMNFHLESNTIIYMGVLPMSASNSSCCWHILQQLYIYTLKITDIYIYVHTYIYI